MIIIKRKFVLVGTQVFFVPDSSHLSWQSFYSSAAQVHICRGTCEEGGEESRRWGLLGRKDRGYSYKWTVQPVHIQERFPLQEGEGCITWVSWGHCPQLIYLGGHTHNSFLWCSQCFLECIFIIWQGVAKHFGQDRAVNLRHRQLIKAWLCWYQVHMVWEVQCDVHLLQMRQWGSSVLQDRLFTHKPHHNLCQTTSLLYQNYLLFSVILLKPCHEMRRLVPWGL